MEPLVCPRAHVAVVRTSIHNRGKQRPIARHRAFRNTEGPHPLCSTILHKTGELGGHERCSRAKGPQNATANRQLNIAQSSYTDFQLMRLRARLESYFLIVGCTRDHTFLTWDSHELTHNLTGSHAETDIPTKVDLLTPSLQHGDDGPGSTNNT